MAQTASEPGPFGKPALVFSYADLGMENISEGRDSIHQSVILSLETPGSTQSSTLLPWPLCPR